MRDGCHCQKCQGQYATERRKERGDGGGRRRREKEERTFAFPKCFLLYHHLCNLTSPPSVITFRGEDNCCVRAAHWPPRIFQEKEKKKLKQKKKKSRSRTGQDKRRRGPVPLLTARRATATDSGPVEERSGCHPRRLAESRFRTSRLPKTKNKKRGPTSDCHRGAISRRARAHRSAKQTRSHETSI